MAYTKDQLEHVLASGVDILTRVPKNPTPLDVNLTDRSRFTSTQVGVDTNGKVVIKAVEIINPGMLPPQLGQVQIGPFEPERGIAMIPAGTYDVRGGPVTDATPVTLIDSSSPSAYRRITVAAATADKVMETSITQAALRNSLSTDEVIDATRSAIAHAIQPGGASTLTPEQPYARPLQTRLPRLR